MKTTKKAKAQNGRTGLSNNVGEYQHRTIKIKQNHSNGKIHYDTRINLFTIMNNMR